MSKLHYSSSKHDDAILITISGNLDAETAPQFSEKLENEMNKGVVKIACNLKDIDFISSAGVGVLISGNQKLKKSGGEIKLVGLSDKNKKIFKLMGFTHVFSIHETNDEALESF